MKDWRTIALSLFALAILVVLFEKSQVHRSAELNRMIDDARLLRELDSNLNRDVLEAESGLQLDYDDIDNTISQLESTHTALDREIEPSDYDLQQRSAAVASHLQHDIETVDKFKSSNSVLRNSIAYLPLYAHEAADAADVDPTPHPPRRVLELLSAFLRCSVECSGPTLNALHEAVVMLETAREHVPLDRRESLDLFFRHARIVEQTLPEVEALTRTMLDGNVNEYDTLYDAALARREGAIERANFYRACLVAFSVVLLLAIVVMIVRLRRNARALQSALLSLDREKHVVEAQRGELEVLNGTLERRVEERTSELLASREQFRRLVETTQAVPWECVPDGATIRYIGPQAATLLGYSLEQLHEDGFLASIMHEADLARTGPWLQNLATTKKDEIEFRFRAANGRYVWVRSFGSAGFDAKGRLVRGGFFLDVSERRQLEADLRAAQKLESVGRLAAGVAHEINTPIQFVNDSVHFVHDSFGKLREVVDAFRHLLDAQPAELPELSAKARALYEEADTEYILDNTPDALESSVEGLHRIAVIVKALKDFSHPDRSQKSPADINANIRNTLTIAANEYKHVADVVTRFGELPPVVCHAGEINQVLLNLVVNAAHAIGDVVGSSGRRGTIEVESRRDGDDVVIVVRDTGSGIPVDVQERIFDPFFTTKEVGRGTGQGLSIARNIVVEKHGGDLSFESEVGRGTEFRLRLPIVGTEPRAAVAA